MELVINGGFEEGELDRYTMKGWLVLPPTPGVNYPAIGTGISRSGSNSFQLVIVEYGSLQN